ncbi:hypothetical protein [Marinobacter qingdaonensis]|uniref:Helix-turn-helix domain-containing protein n=1 Tax=Marinobacter qingdaonensis TaxID=3108486 RepID=A0ABU5P213_9GAMM|nr:hypothetical protein [Marinobacter sp. ASW11-75]MEA1081977.1 hypothetical protein [Marinobacter sp. ASW11-75]
MTEEKKAPAGGNLVESSEKALGTHAQYNHNHSSLLILAVQLSPRHVRLLQRLLAGPLPRLEADRVAGTTNGPEYVGQLRHDFLIQIKTQRIEVIDRDGFKTRPGVYHLKPESRERAQALLDAYEARRAAG